MPIEPTAPASGLPPALPGERREIETAAGRIAYYASAPDGPGPGRTPLLLIHSVNAAASAAEVRPLYEHYRRQRPVYALDLPGFGHSERSARRYTPRLMTDALAAMLDEIERRHGDRPVDALAVSLSCEFLARLALERPHRLGDLALVSPTGFSGGRRLDGWPGSTLDRPALHRLLEALIRSDCAYRRLARPTVIRFFLRKTWGSKAIDETLFRYDVETVRQPGARHAPTCFLAGQLFSADITRVYELVGRRVWMSHGTRGDFVDYRGKAVVANRPNWRIDVFDTGAMPYFEQPAIFTRRLDAFLDGGPGGTQAAGGSLSSSGGGA